jgi:holo-[acyl-carrier protein] synthase
MQQSPTFPQAQARILGVGVDICRIQRLAAAYSRHGDRLVQRLLTPAEQTFFSQRYEKSPQRGLQFLSSRFAAKEALSKALGSGIRGLMGFQSASVLPDELGKPCIHLHGDLTKMFAHHRWLPHISISDEEDCVVAYCLIEILAA